MLSVLPSVLVLGLVALVALQLALRRPSPPDRVAARIAAANALAVTVGVQTLHFAEEAATGFHVRFPALFGLSPMPLSFFVVFNAAWIGIWIASISGLRSARLAAYFAAWFLALAGIMNGIAHPLLAVAVGGYFPGLLTSPFIGGAGVWFWLRLRRATRPKGHGPVTAMTVCFLCVCGSVNAQGIDWTQADAGRLSARVAAGQYGQITSLWIEHNGDILYEEYFHGAGPDTHHNMRSAGKTVTGMLIGTAIEDGQIDSVDTLAASFFDDLRPFENDDPRKESITLKDLLTMSGPLECDDWNSFSRGNEERMYLVEDWSSFFWNLPIKNRPSWEIPEDDGGFDRLFAYCTAGVQLLGEIVERAVGESAPDYAARRLLGPIGVEDPKWNFASTGKAHLGGGLELTTADWAAVARLYLNRGRIDDARIVPESWIGESLADYVQIDDATNFGYLWWRPRYEIDGKRFTANMMSGSGGNRVYLLPEFGIVAVVTKSDFRDRDAHATSDRLFTEEIVERLRVP